MYKKSKFKRTITLHPSLDSNSSSSVQNNNDKKLSKVERLFNLTETVQTSEMPKKLLTRE